MKDVSGIRPLRGVLRLLPLGAKLGFIVGIFVAIVTCLVVLVAMQLEILSAVRAYVGGEALYSKGQKDAVHHLLRFSESQDEVEYREFQAAIAIPVGDKRARLELEKAVPDLAVVHQGFVQGRNHPDDVPGMARLFRRFRHVSYMSKAIAIWAAGDHYVAKLSHLGEALHAEIVAGRGASVQVTGILDEISTVDRRLTQLEDAFSRTLAKGARRLRLVLLNGIIAAAALLVSIGALLSWMMLRHIRAWESRYRHLLDTAGDAILVTSLGSGRILDANRRAEELLGVPRTQLVGMPALTLHPENRRDRHREVIEEVRRAGRATASDLALRHSGGETVPVEVSAVVTELGGERVVQSIYRDMTERLRAEDELRASEERYRDLFENANDVVYTHDLAGRFTSINKAAERVTGYTAAEACRLNIADLVVPEHRKLVRDMIDRKLAAAGATVYELEIVARDGRRVPLEVSTRLLVRDGVPVGVQGIARDIAERKRAEGERTELLARERAARTDAEQANRVKDEFLSVLSHELRTPLTPILMWTHMLERGTLAPEAVARALATIRQSARAQAQLIDELLDVSRIISGKLRLEVEAVEMAGVVEAALESVRFAAEAKSIQLETDIAADVGRIRGDATRLQQVVWNLVANAIKFTPANGRVDIGLERRGAEVVLTVSDTGMGIAPDFLPHLFERFRQADSSSTRQHGGLGLGLAIVRHLVELHGGSVQAESAGAGAGATFTVRLRGHAMPSGRVQIPSTPAQQHDGGSTIEGLRILVVDDERDICDMLATLLATCGAEAKTALSVADALAILDHWSADVVVADIAMPGQDGYALLRALQGRAREGRPAIPAVALTAYARIQDRATILKAGFARHVPKPVEPNELLAVVASVAGRGPQPTVGARGAG